MANAPQRSIQIYFPPEEHNELRAALQSLAADLITDEEAGQRGARVSILVRMLLSAYIRNPAATVAALHRVKQIANGDDTPGAWIAFDRATLDALLLAQQGDESLSATVERMLQTSPTFQMFLEQAKKL